ncbi:SMN family protein Smn1 [Reticulomyxa filosa]|uniref:SMN family protein Smn1 n=1 Tax=Reticulomyxa filosa TaxID=46433 RepID=X6PFE8_RETFI|nr:SMN family protein Smn1 [Reticulomyxa filosa]|eukprot:ETO36789.1 SMN family protein Smn1 [Reticulomyxa filosa]
MKNCKCYFKIKSFKKNLLELGADAWDDSELVQAFEESLEDFRKTRKGKQNVIDMAKVPSLINKSALKEKSANEAEAKSKPGNNEQNENGDEDENEAEDEVEKPLEPSFFPETGEHAWQITQKEETNDDNPNNANTTQTQQFSQPEQSWSSNLHQTSHHTNPSPIPNYFNIGLNTLPPPPRLSMSANANALNGYGRDEALTQMLLAWYWSGYYAGYQAGQTYFGSK